MIRDAARVDRLLGGWSSGSRPGDRDASRPFPCIGNPALSTFRKPAETALMPWCFVCEVLALGIS